jgi:hypothetical protein
MRPLKHTEIHLVNTSSLLDTLVSILRPLLSARIKQHVSKMCKYDKLLAWNKINGTRQSAKSNNVEIIKGRMDTICRMHGSPGKCA